MTLCLLVEKIGEVFQVSGIWSCLDTVGYMWNITFTWEILQVVE